MSEIANVRSEPFLISASQYTIELLCCGVAKIISVAGPPGDEGRRTLTVSVSVETIIVYCPVISNSQSLHLILTPEHCLQSLGSLH